MKSIWMKQSKFLLTIVCFMVFASCQTEYTTKPRGFIRIDLPEKSYAPIVTDCPYSFEIPTYAYYVPDNRAGSDPCWFNVEYPQFKAVIHFSYKPISNNLSEYLEDSRTLTNKHISKASNILESVIIKDDSHVFGVIYNIEGSQAASPMQFHLTDSVDHFLRGALYFNVAPNNDSLAPVIDFLKEDAMHLIETLKWKS